MKNEILENEFNFLGVNQKWVKLPTDNMGSNIIINNILNRSIGIYIKNNHRTNIKIQRLFKKIWEDTAISNSDLQDCIFPFISLQLVDVDKCDIFLLIDDYIVSNLEKYIKEIIESKK